MLKREEAVEMLKAGVQKLSSSDEFERFLAFKQTVRNYSLHNTLMILLQKRDATVVGGLRNFWNKHGRYVRKGEKAIAIWAPLFGKKKHEDGTEDTFIRGFKTVPVFDLSQTEGKPLPEHPTVEKLTGEDERGLYDMLAAHVTDSGLTLLREVDPEFADANGSYSKLSKTIRVRPDLSPMQSFKTLAHEVAHWFLHSDDKGMDLTRPVKETEAEAAAFLTLAHFGIRADSYSFGYVAGWSSGNLKMIERSLSRIEKAANHIIKVVEERLEAKAETANAEPAVA